MADVDLHAVEARLDSQRGGAAVVVGDAFDAGGVDGAQARAHGGKAARGGQGGGAIGARVGHRPGVADLGRRRRTLRVDGVGQAPQAGQVGLVQQQAVAVRAPFGRHGQVGHGGEGGAAGSHAAVEVDQRVADGATRHHALEGGRLDDAVAQRERAQGGRREDGRRRGSGAGGAGRHGPTFADPPAGRTLGAQREAAAGAGRSGGPATPQQYSRGTGVGARLGLRMVMTASSPPPAQMAPEMNTAVRKPAASSDGCNAAAPVRPASSGSTATKMSPAARATRCC